MNYIKRLEAELSEAKANAEAAKEAADDLRNYLLSEKFRCGDSLDSYVNVADVLNRLDSIVAPLR